MVGLFSKVSVQLDFRKIVNAMTFYKKKNSDKLVQDQFLQPVKDHPCLKEKKHVFYFLKIFKGNQTFQKVPCFTLKLLV